MAEWGKGDPRWIVEDRPDGKKMNILWLFKILFLATNPNNWHWVNKDVSAWTQEYLENDLIGISAEADGVTAKVDKVVSMDGDVDVSQRKGKVITLFDVKLKLEYSGKPVFTIPLGSPSISHLPRLRIDNILVGNFVPLLFISSILKGPEFCY